MSYSTDSPFAGARPPRFDPAPGGGPPTARLSRPARRRFAALREARQVLRHLPAEGETLHALMTGTYDLTHLLVALLGELGGPCERMRVATLSLSARNVAELAALLDAGAVRRLDLACSGFFRRHDREVFANLLRELGRRAQRVAAARSHCKVVTLALDDGRRYVLEGSANLRSNRNAEQFALSRAGELHGWYDAWLERTVLAHEVHESDGPAEG